MTESTNLTPEFRVSFPFVFRPQPAMEQGGKSYFTLDALFSKGADLTKLRAMAKAACVKKWGADAAKWPKNMRNPFKDQANKSKHKGYEPGAIFMTLKTENKPGLVNQLNERIIEEAEFYPGCYAHATVNCKAYEKAGNAGVAFYLNNVQKTRDGEPLGGRARAEDEFSPVSGGEDESSPASTDGGDIFGE